MSGVSQTMFKPAKGWRKRKINMDEFSNGWEIHNPPKANVKMSLGTDTNLHFIYHADKVPNAFQRWLLKKLLGINVTLVKE